MSPPTDEEPIAIIGMAMRLPGGIHDEESFWETLCSKRSTHSSPPSSRWSPSGFDHITSQGGHFIDQDLNKWDTSFFNITPQEASSTDPQQRLMLEVAYEAFENAGLAMSKLSGSKTGCWIGCSATDWRELLYRDIDSAPQFAETGSSPSMMSGRISWFFNLKGPSVTICAACSSSMVALDAACTSIRAGKVETAVVGASALMLSPDTCTGFQMARFLSPDGLCKAFDSRANGFGRAEGVNAVVLKRLSLAIRDGDPIRAVVRATAASHNGWTKGITHPSKDAQCQLIRDIYASAGLDPKDTGYVEAHGTGTAVGDPAELGAISQAFNSRTRRDKLFVGSVKSNIGHAEGAAGLAGLIKSVLVLEKGLIPATRGIYELTPDFSWGSSCLEVVQDLTVWPESSPKRISVSSFGASGTNAHVILDRFTQSQNLNGHVNGHVEDVALQHELPDLEASRHRIFVLSAHDNDSLQQQFVQLSRHLQNVSAAGLNEDEYLRDLAFTLSERRSLLTSRCGIVASSLRTLQAALDESAGGIRHQGEVRNEGPRCIFVFTGQGAQWPRMGIELLRFPVFRRTMLLADEFLQKEVKCPWSPLEELAKTADSSEMDDPSRSQLLCTVLQIALVDLLASWDILPDIVVGHSSGEMAAAYCQGALSRENCWRLAYWRGVFSSEGWAPDDKFESGMLAAALSPEEATKMLEQVRYGYVTVACENSPSNVTFSGTLVGIEELKTMLEQQGIWHRQIKVPVAYHSKQMNFVAIRYLPAIKDCLPSDSAANCVMLSSTTGDFVEASELTPAHWTRNLMMPVKFSTAFQKALEMGDAKGRRGTDVVFELGPHGALASAIRENVSGMKDRSVEYLSALTRGRNGIETLLSAVCQLWGKGLPVSLDKVNAEPAYTPKVLTSLPSYAWNRRGDYKPRSRMVQEYINRKASPRGLLGASLPALSDKSISWRGFIDLDQHQWLVDHNINGTAVVPAAAWLCVVMQAGRQTIAQGANILRDRFRHVRLLAAATVSEGQRLEVILSMRPIEDSEWWNFSISTWTANSSREVCRGLWRIQLCPAVGSNEAQEQLYANAEARRVNIETKARSSNTLRPDEFYETMAGLGFNFGPCFQNLSQIQVGRMESWAELEWNSARKPLIRDCLVDPAKLDAIFNVILAAIWGQVSLTAAHVPSSFAELDISARLADQDHSPDKLHLHVQVEMLSRQSMRSNISAVDDTSQAEELIRLSNVETIEVTDATGHSDRKIICGRLLWSPDFSLLSAEQAADAFESCDLSYKGCEHLLGKLASIVNCTAQAKAGTKVLQIGESDELPRMITNPPDGISRVFEYSRLSGNIPEGANGHAMDAMTINTLSVDRVSGIEQWHARPRSSEERFDMVVICADTDCAATMPSATQILQLHNSSMPLCIFGPSAESVREDMEELGIQTVYREADRLIVMGSLNSDERQSKLTAVTIVIPESSSVMTETCALQLQVSLTEKGINSSIELFSPDLNAEGRAVVTLLELETSFFSKMTASDLQILQRLLADASMVLWVTALADPTRSLVTGFARSLCQEQSDLELRTVLLRPLRIESLEHSIGFLSSIVLRRPNDWEHEEDPRGILTCPRVTSDEIIDNSISIRPALIGGVSTLGSVSHALGLKTLHLGNFESMILEERDEAELALGPDEVLLETKASGMNFKDIVIATGKVKRSWLGGEASGVVAQVGSGVSGFRPGDRVFCLTPGAHASRLKVAASMCRHVPDGWNFAEAASIAVNHCTAYHSIIGVRNGQLPLPGQSILIHAAAGGVGQVLVQIAQHCGMEIYASVGSEAKRDLLVREYGLPEDHILNSRDASFASAIKRMTGGRGVDLVVNSLAGDLARETLTCLVPGGTFVELSKGNRLQMPLDTDVKFVAFDLETMLGGSRNVLSETLDNVLAFLKLGITRPVSPITTYPASGAQFAFRDMAAGKHTGKLVLSWEEESLVRFIRNVQRVPDLALNDTSTYVLVGGLGGLGRNLAQQLVNGGARHLCFLSRSGMGSSEAVRQLVEDLQSQGVKVYVYACDVGDPDQLSAAIADLHRKAPRVRGVMQCAMAIHDVLFQNMQQEDWESSLRPKVQGTWNLHQQFQKDLDFFIILSSLVAIVGNLGQTNYGAACAYQDDLAKLRRSQGLKAVSINLGIMRDIGAVAEGKVHTSPIRQWAPLVGIREQEFKNLMRMVIDDQMHNRGKVPAQLTTGIPDAKRKTGAGQRLDVTSWLRDAKFSLLDNNSSAETDQGAAEEPGRESSLQSARQQLAQCKSIEAGRDFILREFAEKCAEWLQMSRQSIDTAVSLSDYGFNSLSAVEAQNWLARHLGVKAKMFDLLSDMSLEDLSESFAKQLLAQNA